MRHPSWIAGAVLALGLSAPASAATIVFQDSFGFGPIGFASLIIPKYDGPGVITGVTLSFRGTTNQYFDVFGGDDPQTLPAFDTSWIIGLEGPADDNVPLDEALIEATYPEFEVPVGVGEEHTRFTPIMDVALDASDSRFGLYSGTGFNEFFVYGFGDVQIQAGGTLTVTLTTNGVVPEPGTWALMLLGFGTVGAALRAQRRAVA